jgi:hypothetical protein
MQHSGAWLELRQTRDQTAILCSPPQTRMLGSAPPAARNKKTSPHLEGATQLFPRGTNANYFKDSVRRSDLCDRDERGARGGSRSRELEIESREINVLSRSGAQEPDPQLHRIGGGYDADCENNAADGKESTSTLTFKGDGKPYPASGNPDFDMVSVTRVDASTVHSIQTKAGAPVGTGVRTVSKDGKTLTFAQKGTHANGVKYDDVSVYDRQ